jgi:hypothetical protein
VTIGSGQEKKDDGKGKKIGNFAAPCFRTDIHGKHLL